MSVKPEISDFIALKGQRKIVCLTAYSAPMAHALDPHCDLLLVGDSVAMVIYGMDTTQNADLDMMIRHGQAVMRRRQSALVVIDLPLAAMKIVRRRPWPALPRLWPKPALMRSSLRAALILPRM